MEQQKRNVREKKEVTLMTLLANEAAEDSIKVLKKYKPDEKVYDFADLENKLSDLYVESANKAELEKELAEIHPHKKWLLKYIQPRIEIKKEIVEVAKPEVKSNCEGNPNCNCKKKADQSSFDGGNKQELMTMTDYIGLSLVVSVIGVSFYIATKNYK